MLLVFFIGVYLLELLLLWTPAWSLRKLLTPLLIGSILASSVLLAWQFQLWYAAIILTVALFRVVSLARILKGRMHYYYLLHAARRTSLTLLGLQFLACYVYLLTSSYFSGYQQLGLLVSVQVVGACLVFATALKNTLRLKYFEPKRFLSADDMPTVSVCIPARNETQDLEQCVRSVLRSDYPKLEIIVLDDCSQAKTADIIKSFAHDGVRFVRGDEPVARWLAKNQAYHKLYKEAKGQLVMFIGVDVRLSRTAIRAMVNTMYDRRKAMLSVLPTRERLKTNAAIFQPMRYWWELAPPRRLFNRPPVLSTCWIIDRQFLKSLGGLASVSHSILPEGHFAREAVKQDLYSFIRASGELGVQTVKNQAQQRQTVLRVRYPQLRRRPENVLLVTIVELALLLAPLPMLILLWAKLGWLVVPLTLTVIMIGATHALILRLTNRSNFLLAFVTFPLAAIAELVAGYASMFTYEFGTVTWKERNVCLPVMHTISKYDFLAKGDIK